MWYVLVQHVPYFFLWPLPYMYIWNEVFLKCTSYLLKHFLANFIQIIHALYASHIAEDSFYFLYGLQLQSDKETNINTL